MAERQQPFDTLPIVRAGTADSILKMLGFDPRGNPIADLNGQSINHMHLAGQFALDEFRRLMTINHRLVEKLAEHVKGLFQKDINNFDRAYETGMAIVLATLSTQGGKRFNDKLGDLNPHQFDLLNEGLSQPKVQATRAGILDEALHAAPIPDYQPALIRAVDLAGEGVYHHIYTHKVRIGAGTVYNGLRFGLSMYEGTEHGQRHTRALNRLAQRQAIGVEEESVISTAIKQPLLSPPNS